MGLVHATADLVLVSAGVGVMGGATGARAGAAAPAGLARESAARAPAPATTAPARSSRSPRPPRRRRRAPGSSALRIQRRLQQQFDGDYKLKFHLAPPLLAKKDAQGRLIKQEFGPWVFTAFKWMAKLRKLRGGTFDIFGYTEERKMERRLIGEYEQTIGGLLAKLDGGNVDLAAEIAGIPEHIRGYGHVKEEHLHKAKAREAELLKEFANPLRIVQAA